MIKNGYRMNSVFLCFLFLFFWKMKCWNRISYVSLIHSVVFSVHVFSTIVSTKNAKPSLFGTEIILHSQILHMIYNSFLLITRLHNKREKTLFSPFVKAGWLLTLLLCIDIDYYHEIWWQPVPYRLDFQKLLFDTIEFLFAGIM